MLQSSVTCFVIALSLAAPAPAQEHETDKRSKRTSLVLSSEVLIGADVVDGSSRKIDSVEDFVLHAESGRIELAVLSSGTVHPCGELEWQADEKNFRLAPSRYHAGRVRRDTNTATTQGQRILCSKLAGLPLIGVERTEKGRTEEKLDSTNGVFIDITNGYLAFVTVSLGGVLGIGADSKVVPWCAVDLRRGPEGEQKLHTRLSRKRFEKAPNYGEGEKQLHNPEYRSRLYSYYGVDRPAFDRTLEDDEHGRLVTLASVLGAPVRRGGEQTDGVKDVLVDSASGQAAFAILKSGSVLRFASLKWSPDDTGFATTGADAGSIEVKNPNDFVTARALSDYAIKVRGGKDAGSVEDIYLDTQSNKLAYVTIAVGTTLGFGGEVKVLPWEMVRLEKQAGEKEPLLRLPISEKELTDAPELDGKTGADIHSPTFRERVRRLSETRKEK